MTAQHRPPHAMRQRTAFVAGVTRVLGTFLFAVLTFSSLVPSPVHAINLPTLENLSPKWEQLSIGLGVDQVITIMGEPGARDVNEWLGLRVEVLTWTDYRRKFTARFIAGRLASKHFIN